MGAAKGTISDYLALVCKILLQCEDVGPNAFASSLRHSRRQHLWRVLHEELHVLQQVHVLVDAVQQLGHLTPLDAVEVHASQLHKEK